MLSARDRLLAALFAFQLAVAAVLGFYLVRALNKDDRPTVVTQAPVGTAAPTAVATAAPQTTAPAGQGTPGRTVTTTNGGTGGSAVTPGTADKEVIPAGAPIKIGAVVS